MWEGFLAEYKKRKGASTKSSVLDKVLVLCKVYPEEGSNALLKSIETELVKVKKATRIFSENPAIKYALPIAALEEEIFAEKGRLNVQKQVAAAAISARVKAKGSGATDSGPAEQGPLSGARARNFERWNALLAAKPTETELRTKMESAFAGMCREPKFAKYYLDEMGWTNTHAWLTWGLRTATPAMLKGADARDAQAFLREVALAASVSGHSYAERYLLELSIYCSHEADRADVSFVLSQASSLFGTLLGPVISQLGWGVAGVAARAGKMAGEIGAGVAAPMAFAESEGDTRDVEISSDGDRAKPLMTAMNAMRFTHAWLRYVTLESSLSADARTVVKEFGGVRGCDVIYDKLMNM